MKVNSTTKWCVALTAAIVLFYWKLLFPGQFTFLTGGEDTNQAYSWLNFWIRSLRHGTLPLWDPYAVAGYCFPGEMQTAAFNPLHLLLLLFPLNPNGMLTPMEYHILFLFAHALAGLFMFALIRELQLSRFAGFVSGFCFSAGAFLGRVPWPHMLESAIWLPLIFLFLLRAVKRSDPRCIVLNALWSGICLGFSILAGGLHIAIAQAIVVITALVFYGAQREHPAVQAIPIRHNWRKATSVGALILVTGLCAGAIQLLPSHLYAEHSLRWYGSVAFPGTEKPPYQYVSDNTLSPRGLLTVLFPLFEGMGQGESWSPYIGAFPFLLAVLAVIRCWSNLWIRYFFSLVLASFAYCLGSSAFHGVLYTLVPFLWMAREATRFLYLAGFALAILAAFGIDLIFFSSLPAPFLPSLKRALSRIMLGCLLTLLIFTAAPRAGNYWVEFSLVLILAACALLWLVLSRQHGDRAGFQLLAITVVFFDLSVFSLSPGNKIEAERAGTSEYQTLRSLEGAIHFLQKQPAPYRVAIFRNPPPNLGDAYGIPNVSGAGVTLGIDFVRVHADYDLLNARYLIKPSSTLDPGPIYQDASWKIYQNPNAFPRSWLVHEVKIEPNDEQLYDDLERRHVDPHRIALLRAPLPQSVGAAPGPVGETVSLQSYSAHVMNFAVHATSPALLVLSEVYYPEWQARVNGHGATIYKTNGAFRGVLVPGGNSVVELVYQPWSVYTGAVLSVLAFATAATGVFSSWRRRGVEHHDLSEINVTKA
jgi:hypothetical protein